MGRVTLILAIGVTLLGSTASAGATGSFSRIAHVDACLRAHGWPYGLLALRHAEIRVRHPNGLVRTCRRADAISRRPPTASAPVTVGASHEAPTSAVRPLPPKLRARGELRSYQRAQPAEICVVARSSTGGLNRTAVGLSAGLSILGLGAFGIAAYRLRVRRSAPVR